MQRDKVNMSENQQLLAPESKGRWRDGQRPEEVAENKERELREAPPHPETLNHQEFLQDKIYTACYPVGAKVTHMLKSIFRQANSSVEILEKAKNLAGGQRDITQDEKILLQGKILQVRINEISNQELDPNVAHPFVRVHIVNMKTGVYLKKISPEKDCLVRGESLTAYDDIAKEYYPCRNDLIPAFATNCVDLREAGGARARWNETILINEECENILKEDVVILFEVLDFNPKQLQCKELNNLDQDMYYKIAWGYIRPMGLAKNHFGLSKIQLYKYIFDSQKLQQKQRKHFIPLVYFDFIWPDRNIKIFLILNCFRNYIPNTLLQFNLKTNYDGYLTIQLNPVDRPVERRVNDNAMNVFEIERDEKYQYSHTNRGKLKEMLNKEQEEEILEKDRAKGRRMRDPRKPCEIPDKKLVAKFISSDLGCLRLSFSPNGKILAAACTNKRSETCIKLFDVDELFREIYQFRGHANLIHCLSWISSTRNFSLLSSSSSDFSNIIWKVPFFSCNLLGLIQLSFQSINLTYYFDNTIETDEYIDQDESEEFYLVSKLAHPSYVYCSAFYPLRKGSGNIVLVTGCFDQYIRFWQLSQDQIGQQLSKTLHFTENLILILIFLIVIIKIECSHKILITDKQSGQDGFEQFDNLLEHRHPNCIEFDSQSLMFIGDSLGLIHLFTVTTILDDPSLIRWQRTIRDPSLIGDPITQLHYIQNKKYLIVHNRSNCIRNLEINQNNHQINKNYIGAFSSKFPVHSCVSPDEVWLLGGSEDGQPHLWHIEGTDQQDLSRLEYSIEGVVSDVAWNSVYHMIAISGFGKDHPICLYVHEEDADLTVAQYRDLKERLDQQEKTRIQFDIDQGFQQDPYDPNRIQARQNPYSDY